jgi:hypothetical protein
MPVCMVSQLFECNLALQICFLACLGTGDKLALLKQRCTALQAQKQVLRWYANYTDQIGVFKVVRDRNWLQGVLDLTLTAQDLDADAGQLSLYMSGTSLPTIQMRT